MSWKQLFARSLSAAPDRLHFAAHSHHLWPNASFAGQIEAWEDAARLADRKWDRVMGEVWPEAQGHVAAELNLPDPSTVVFAPNTHDLLVRIVSANPQRPLRILTSDGEFHSFRRQATRWAEDGSVVVETVATGEGFAARFIAAAQRGGHDMIWVSHVMFGTGQMFGAVADLAALASPDGPWVVIDGYHGFMALPIDLSGVADRIFYIGGGYKYAMAGEGVAFVHAPHGYAMRPAITGWYAKFDDLTMPPGKVGYARDARRLLGATFDPSGLYRFNAVQRTLADEGLTTTAISAHVEGLQRRALDRLAGTRIGSMDLLNPLDHAPHARFLAFRSPDAAALHAALAGAGVVTDLRGDVLRIGFGLYHDAADVERLGEIAGTLD